MIIAPWTCTNFFLVFGQLVKLHQAHLQSTSQASSSLDCRASQLHDLTNQSIGPPFIDPAKNSPTTSSRPLLLMGLILLPLRAAQHLFPWVPPLQTPKQIFPPLLLQLLPYILRLLMINAAVKGHAIFHQNLMNIIERLLK